MACESQRNLKYQKVKLQPLISSSFSSSFILFRVWSKVCQLREGETRAVVEIWHAIFETEQC